MGHLIRAALALALAAALAPAAPLTERWRPLYHFTPARNWINDPNGLVFWDGEYHLFYQYNPRGDLWGHMSWGHAVSADLARWTELPVALTAGGGKMYFSGSAVVDHANTSGFGPDGRPPLVAIYTGVVGEVQRQEIARSADRGRTWTEYAGNPVLDIGSREFRDPKVFWHEPSRRWVMVVSRGADRFLSFFGSPDLKRWRHLSDFGPAGARDKPNWECPDLFELPVEDEPGRTRWVLKADLGGGAPAGGSGGEYFVGSFDGTRFVSDGPADEVLWVDHGPDFYASQSWSDAPGGRRIWVGWMSNWEYAREVPTSPWRGGMSFPRELALRRTAEGLRLVQRPAAELERLRGPLVAVSGRDVAELSARLAEAGLRGRALEIEAEIEPGEATDVGLAVRRGRQDETRVGYDVARRELYVDRSRSGAVAFHPAFAARHRAPLPLEDGRLRLRVLVDASSVEVFGGGGRVVLTELVFPREGSDGVALFARGGRTGLMTVRAWRLAPAGESSRRKSASGFRRRKYRDSP